MTLVHTQHSIDMCQQILTQARLVFLEPRLVSQ